MTVNYIDFVVHQIQSKISTRLLNVYFSNKSQVFISVFGQFSLFLVALGEI
jgi:hypothetical protein